MLRLTYICRNICLRRNMDELLSLRVRWWSATVFYTDWEQRDFLSTIFHSFNILRAWDHFLCGCCRALSSILKFLNDEWAHNNTSNTQSKPQKRADSAGPTNKRSYWSVSCKCACYRFTSVSFLFQSSRCVFTELFLPYRWGRKKLLSLPVPEIAAQVHFCFILYPVFTSA